MNHNGATRLALLPDRIWDGEANSIAPNLAVILEGSRIVEIKPVNELPAAIERLDLAGCTLLPGLIDSHVHYTESSGPAFLAAGVTTVRDTGNDLEWILGQRTRNNAEPGRGPRIVCCGRLLDGMEGNWTHTVKRHQNAASLVESIRENVARGVDAIKLYASIDEQLLRAGVEAAHAHGKFVLAHLNKTSAAFAADADLDEIEHFSRCDVAWREASPQEDDGLIDRFLKHGTIMNPTVNVWDRLGRAWEHAFRRDDCRRWLHPDLRDIWDRFPYRRCDPSHRLRFQKVMPNLKRFFLRCHQRGVTIAAGTDTPFINLIPGFSLHDELAQYVDTGLAPIDALRAATSTNARILGLEDRIGRIKPGMDADLVAVRGNPLERIDALGDTAAVIRQGRVLQAEELFKALSEMSRAPMDDPIIRDLRTYVAGEMPTYSQKSGD